MKKIGHLTKSEVWVVRTRKKSLLATVDSQRSKKRRLLTAFEGKIRLFNARERKKSNKRNTKCLTAGKSIEADEVDPLTEIIDFILEV